MSYILDALRKADAQRERDPARGIHAHPIPSAAAPAAGSRAPWMASAAALALVLIALVAWYLARETQGPSAAAVAVSPSSAAPASAAPQVAVVAPPVAATAVMPPPPAPAAPAAQPALPSPAVHLPAPPPVVAAAATGLPPDAPRVAISGGVYSPSPAQRMLIVNGQVFNEGSEVAPGVAIDEIRPRTAVLRFRGARYTVAY